MQLLDYMRSRSRNFQRFWKLWYYCPLWNPGKNVRILDNLVVFDDLYLMKLCIFDLAKFAYYVNDASKCSVFFCSRNGMNF